MMFADDQFLDPHRKRPREDEEDLAAGGSVGFSEHRSKRLHSLPFRTSPTSQRWVDRSNSFPLTHAPHNQAAMPPDPTHDPQMWADEPELAPLGTFYQEHLDDDMDMMDTSETSAAPDQSGIQAQPIADPALLSANPNVPSVTGRIPTPIHCNFPAQVRSKSWNGGSMAPSDVLATTPEEPNAAAFSSNALVDIASQRLSAATAAQVMAEWSMVQNRRLPSPISECGGEEHLDTGARMALDLSSSPGAHHHLNHLTHEHPLLAGLPPRASSAMDGRAAREGTPALLETQAAAAAAIAMDIESPATPSPKKGHTRSKHTVNSWTALQPGMKRSFSIGYRADCEKCRMKVPGHFNHIIIS